MTEEGGNWDTDHHCKPAPCVPRLKKIYQVVCICVRVRINFEAVIEVFVCATDVRQDGGPSLSGKPEQEEQTPH